MPASSYKFQYELWYRRYLRNSLFYQWSSRNDYRLIPTVVIVPVAVVKSSEFLIYRLGLNFHCLLLDFVSKNIINSRQPNGFIQLHLLFAVHWTLGDINTSIADPCIWSVQCIYVDLSVINCYTYAININRNCFLIRTLKFYRFRSFMLHNSIRPIYVSVINFVIFN